MMGKFSPALGIGLVLGLAACQSQTPQPTPSANSVAAPVPTGKAGPSAAPAGPPAQAQAMTTKNPLYRFSYSWPAAAAALPELNSWLRANGETLERALRGNAQVGRAADGKDYIPYSYAENYAVVADTPRLLVLLSSGYAFRGGEAGAPVRNAILWDKAAKQRVTFGEMIDFDHFTAAGQGYFCNAIDQQRTTRRHSQDVGDARINVGPDGAVRVGDATTTAPSPATPSAALAVPLKPHCPDIARQLIVPVSEGGRALDTIRIFTVPDPLNPKASGYMVELGMDNTLMAMVKPEWRSAFAAAYP